MVLKPTITTAGKLVYTQRSVVFVVVKQEESWFTIEPLAVAVLADRRFHKRLGKFPCLTSTATFSAHLLLRDTDAPR